MSLAEDSAATCLMAGKVGAVRLLFLYFVDFFIELLFINILIIPVLMHPFIYMHNFVSKRGTPAINYFALLLSPYLFLLFPQ